MLDTRNIKTEERKKLLVSMDTDPKWLSFFEWLMDREGRVVHNDPRDPGGHTA